MSMGQPWRQGCRGKDAETSWIPVPTSSPRRLPARFPTQLARVRSDSAPGPPPPALSASRRCSASPLRGWSCPGRRYWAASLARLADDAACSRRLSLRRSRENFQIRAPGWDGLCCCSCGGSSSPRSGGELLLKRGKTPSTLCRSQDLSQEARRLTTCHFPFHTPAGTRPPRCCHPPSLEDRTPETQPFPG